MYEHFIKKKYEVEDEDKACTFKSGSGPMRKPRNVVLCGLQGSGRGALAENVAACHDLEVVRPVATAEALEALGQETGRLVILGPEHMDVPDAMTLIPRMGYVFFLMADVPFVIEARKIAEEEERERLAAVFPDLEMRFHALGGLPLSAYRSLEENAAQIAEVLEMCP